MSSSKMKMMNNSYDHLIDTAISAGKAILEIYYSKDFAIELKGDESPLTKADKAAHLVIQSELEKTGIPILSEEGKAIDYAERKHWNKFWMVDPLDGTKEFIKKNGEFTVNIALIENGEPTFGIVHTPVTGETFIGGVNYPAIKLVNGTRMQLDNNKESDSLSDFIRKEGLRVVASRSHLNEETESFLNKMSSPKVVSMGSSLKFLCIADGQADIYPRFAPTMEWDTAAAHAIMNSLGYHILIKDTSIPLQYNKENLLNPHFICF